MCEPVVVPITSKKLWYYDPREFVRQMALVERHTKWKYKGGIQVLILDVLVSDRSIPATIDDMFSQGSARLDHVITAGIEELKTNGLVADFDDFFNAVRNITNSGSQSKLGPTWALSDGFGFAKAGLALDILMNAFGLKWTKALESALKFKYFAVRDLRK